MEERAYSRTSPPAPEALKVPPQSVEAEQSLLGGLMLDNSRWDSIGDKVTAGDFYRREHRLIFNAISALCQENSPADAVTVSEWLEKSGELAGVGGLAYLGTLANNTPSAANIVAYAEIVRERSIMRQLLQAAGDIGNATYSPEGRTAKELLDLAEKRIFDISEAGAHRRGAFERINALLTRAVDRIDTLFRSQSSITGVPTGFTDLDNMTSGLQAADLIIIAGRPSMGKTSLAMNIAENAAVGHKLPVAVFSMEMPGTQLAMRMMASLGRINSHRVRTGKLDDDDWPRLTSAVSLLNEAPIFIDDTPAITPLELRARARRIKREHGLSLIIVDYLQLMQSSDGNNENRATEISNITRALKGLAKELDVPVVAMSQLNRSLESRTDKRPVMSDLRESGSIEQDADVIFFIYRDEVYNEDSPQKGTAEIIIGKQRNGPTGKVTLTFLGEYTRFENYTSAGYGANY
ncbi:MAG: replicative DNA helicase [Candidatus Muproteobacteria bacterium RBG_16_65_31]|uniref:Replicative DNA helicase n=2 Tax=Candidatus Muproteobacteria TaxID=1817795 RepID=A0A1F6TB94_9PROT|nr:MAG: replicative DNA helicase [Candidatus Muproteobacteria bacterium RBG_16_65_31]OGI52087.1 MAG: replicative DNA helicase [Candidatus Muproteobacteria bacterium RIFCSPHIGHO2_02_FULL_65_16]